MRCGNVPSLSLTVAHTNNMVCAEFFGLGRIPSPQRALPPLPHESGIRETCGIPSARVLRKQSPVKSSVVDTRGATTPVSSFARYSLLTTNPLNYPHSLSSFNVRKNVVSSASSGGYLPHSRARQ